MREFSAMKPGSRTVQLEMALACEEIPNTPGCGSGSAWQQGDMSILEVVCLKKC